MFKSQSNKNIWLATRPGIGLFYFNKCYSFKCILWVCISANIFWSSRREHQIDVNYIPNILCVLISLAFQLRNQLKREWIWLKVKLKFHLCSLHRVEPIFSLINEYHVLRKEINSRIEYRMINFSKIRHDYIKTIIVISIFFYLNF